MTRQGKTTNSKHKENDQKCPLNMNLISNRHNTQNKHSHQVGPEEKVHTKGTENPDPMGHSRYVITQRERPPEHSLTATTAESTRHTEILSVHINDTHMSTYNINVGSTDSKALSNSGTMLSCISEHFYDKV